MYVIILYEKIKIVFTEKLSLHKTKENTETNVFCFSLHIHTVRVVVSQKHNTTILLLQFTL